MTCYIFICISCLSLQLMLLRRLRLYCCGLQRYALFWGDSSFRDALHYFVRYSFCGFFVTVVLLVSIQV